MGTADYWLVQVVAGGFPLLVLTTYEYEYQYLTKLSFANGSNFQGMEYDSA